MQSKLLQCNVWTLVQTSYNVLYNRRSDVWFVEVIRWVTAVYASVLQLWDCCSTCICNLAMLYCHIVQYVFPLWIARALVWWKTYVVPVLSHWRTFSFSNHLIFLLILSLNFSILTITVQQSHKDARHITRLSAFELHNSRFRSSKFYTNTFSYAIILATVYDPHLIFLVSQSFCQFCSCANSERS